MYRNRIVRLSALFVAMALLLPVTLTTASAKESKGTLRADIEVVGSVMIGSTPLSAGTYAFVADEGKLHVTRNGKVVAEATIQWQDGKPKSDSSSLVIENNQVKEVRFGGKTRSAVLM